TALEPVHVDLLDAPEHVLGPQRRVVDAAGVADLDAPARHLLGLLGVGADHGLARPLPARPRARAHGRAAAAARAAALARAPVHARPALADLRHGRVEIAARVAVAARAAHAGLAEVLAEHRVDRGAGLLLQPQRLLGVAPAAAR